MRGRRQIGRERDSRGQEEIERQRRVWDMAIGSWTCQSPTIIKTQSEGRE